MTTPAPLSRGKSLTSRKGIGHSYAVAAGLESVEMRRKADFLSQDSSLPRVGFAEAPANAEQEDRNALLILRHMEHFNIGQDPDVNGFTSRFSKLGNEVVVDKLISGAIFYKYPTSNLLKAMPHHRALWCSGDLKMIYWGDLTKSRITGSMRVSEVKCVVSGADTKAFKKVGTPPRDPNLCFSILGADRTVDLETLSQQDRDMWMLALNWLLKTRRDPESRRTPLTEEEEALAHDHSHFGEQFYLNELDLLVKRLKEAHDHIQKLEVVVKKTRGDTTGQESLSPEVYENKMQEEILALRASLAAAKAEVRKMQADQARMTAEVEELTAEVAYRKEMMAAWEQGLPEEAKRERREREREREDLKTRVQLAEIREALKLCQNKEELLFKVGSLDTLIVPVDLLLTPDPDGSDTSDSEEDEDDDEAGGGGGSGGNHGRGRWRGGSGSDDSDSSDSSDDDGDDGGVAAGKAAIVDPSEKKLRAARKRMEALLFEPITVNGQVVPFGAPQDRVDDVIDAVVEVVVLVSRNAVSPAKARETVKNLLGSVNGTQLAGDSYAALSWMAGHPELVVITPDNAFSGGLDIRIDKTGIVLNSTHHFQILDAKKMMSGEEEDVLWTLSTATFEKGVTFDGEELIEDRVVIRFGEIFFKGISRKDSVTSLPELAQRSLAAAAASGSASAAASGGGGAGAVARGGFAAGAAVAVATKKEELEAAEARGGPKLSPEELEKIRKEEREMIRKAGRGQKSKPGFYIINNQWLSDWKSFLAGRNVRPGPINNGSLLTEEGEPKLDLQPSVHYRALSSNLWDVLFKAYGGGPVIFRKSNVL